MTHRVSFFFTCLADTVFPNIGIQSVQLLEQLGCRVSFNPKQTCCGQPLANSGFHNKDKGAMRLLTAALLEDGSKYVVAPSGFCVLQVKEYPKFFKDHPSCHLSRLLGIKKQPLALLENIRDLELVSIKGQDKCCSFGGAFAVKLGPLSGAMVTEKIENLKAANVDYLIGAEGGGLMNMKGRIDREKLNIKVLHVVEALMSGKVEKRV